METNDNRKTDTAKHYHICIDCVIFNFDDGGLKVLVVNDQNEKENYALPSHLIFEGETIESTSNQILKKYAGVEKFYIEQLKVFNHVSSYGLSDDITIGCYALIKNEDSNLENVPKSLEVEWYRIDEALNLNYKQRMILDYSLKELKKRICQSAVGFHLLPEKFTLLQAMHLYEEVLGIEMNKSNFRRKIIKMGLVLDADEKEKDVSHRAAKFYKFNFENYEKTEQNGLNFLQCKMETISKHNKFS